MTQTPSDPDDEFPSVDLDDPLLEELLGDAIGPYMAALSPEQVESYRAFLTIFVTTHPVVAPVYERLRARRAGNAGNAASGEITRDHTSRDDATSAPRTADGTPRKQRA